jgi:type I restriction enzyme S subunit
MTDGPDLQVAPEDWAIVRAILDRLVPDCEVWAFGSRTTGRARRYSDLDLAVLADPPLGIDRQARLLDAFSESDLPWRVDVLDFATASDPFRRIVVQSHRVVKRPGQPTEALPDRSRLRDPACPGN